MVIQFPSFVEPRCPATNWTLRLSKGSVKWRKHTQQNWAVGRKLGLWVEVDCAPNPDGDLHADLWSEGS
jgi:hypothetical protein